MNSDKALLEELDTEWLQLIMEAREMGLKKEEIQEFLNNFKDHQISTVL